MKFRFHWARPFVNSPSTTRFRFSWQGDAVAFPVNGIKFFELIARLFRDVFKALGVTQAEMRGFDGIGFKTVGVVFQALVGADKNGQD